MIAFTICWWVHHCLIDILLKSVTKKFNQIWNNYFQCLWLIVTETANHDYYYSSTTYYESGVSVPLLSYTTKEKEILKEHNLKILIKYTITYKQNAWINEFNITCHTVNQFHTTQKRLAALRFCYT